MVLVCRIQIMSKRTSSVKFIDDFIAKEGIERLNRHAIIKLQTAMSQEEQNVFDIGKCAHDLFKNDAVCDRFREEYEKVHKRPCTEESRYSVQVVDPKDSNAIIFIMKTYKPLKIMLKITSHDLPLTPTMAVNIDELQQQVFELEDLKSTCKNGELKHFDSIGKYSIFVFIFNTMTPCSSAKEADFVDVDFPIAEMKLPEMALTTNVGWSFFSLNADVSDNLEKYFVDKKRLLLNPVFLFPLPNNEDHRIQCLLTTIKRKYQLPNTLADAEKVVPQLETDGYCQFSGGGDIVVHSGLETLVVQGKKEDNEEGDGGLSPISDGTAASTTLSVEGKKSDYSYEKLKYQLFANIVRASIVKFINSMKRFDEKSIEDVKIITGYGASYTGFGDIGFYKLEMNFNQNTMIITKLQLNRRPQQYAAAIMDFILDYFFKKLNQYQK